MARDFDPTTDKITTEVTGHNDTRSWAGWFYWDSLASLPDLFEKGGEERLYSGSDNKIYVWRTYSTSGIVGWRSAGSPLSGTGAWHHIAVTFDVSSVSNDPIIYVNGSKDASPSEWYNGPPAGTANTDTDKIIVAGDNFNGRAAECAVWNRILTDDEVTALAAGASPMFFSDSMVSYMPLIRDVEDYVAAAPTDSGSAYIEHPPDIFYPDTMWPTPAADASQSIDANLIDETTIYNATVSVGAVSITANLIDETTIPNASVSYIISANLIDETTIPNATVTVGAVTISANLIDETSIPNATVTTGAVTVTANLIDETTIYNASVAFSVTANLIDETTIPNATVTVGAVTISGNLIDETQVFNASVSLGAQTITANLIDETQVYNATVTAVVGSLTFVIDWDDDDNFTGTHDDIMNDVIEFDTTLGMRVWERVADESTATIVLNNTDKKYSHDNASSPLFGLLRANHQVQLKFGDTVIWTGYTETFKPTGNQHGDQICVLECVGIKGRLQEATWTIPLQESVTGDTAIEQIISAVLEPTDAAWKLGTAGQSELDETTYLSAFDLNTDFDTGVITFGYIGDFLGDELGVVNLWQEIKHITETERGRFWTAEDGTPTWRNRSAWQVATTVDYTINDDANIAPVFTTPDEDLINRVEVTVHPRVEGADTTTQLWSLNGTSTFASSEAKSWRVLARDPDTGERMGAKDIQTPSGGDFVWSTGGGSVTVDEDGQYINIVVTAAVTGGTLDTLVLTGRSVKSDKAITVVASDPSLVSRYGTRTLKIDLPLTEDPDDGLNIAESELLLRGQEKLRCETAGFVESIDFLASSPATLWKIGDLIRIVDTQTGHDRNYRLMKTRHKFKEASWSLETIFDFEPAPDGLVWLLEDAASQLGTNTYLGL